jgi:hypothetical protein
MIFGTCPYCDASVANAYAGPGKFQQIECDECHNSYWLRHSDSDPEAYTQEQFADRYEADEATKEITDKYEAKRQALRTASPALAALVDKMEEKIVAETTRLWERHLLYGEPFGVEPNYEGTRRGGLAELFTRH